ncbi:MAG: PilN domain-containing protein [Halieaceae bacterium]
MSTESGPLFYQGGQLLETVTDCSCEAILLPDDLVLAKTLEMPVTVELDLETVMGYEVLANSPFPEADTGSGWQLIGKTETHIQVRLAIVSLSATMTYIAREYDIHDIHAREVWVSANDTMIVLSGFGEGKRESLYRRRLIKAGIMVMYCALVLLLISGALAFGKYLELQRYQQFAADIQGEAKSAASMRESVLRANDTMTAVNGMLDANPSPHFELARLTGLLGDDTYLESLAIAGREVRVRGRAVNAAEIMEMLIKETAYSTVTAPQAIIKTSDGQERFTLTITLAGDGEADES